MSPEAFFRESGLRSLALLLPTKAATTAHLSPTNLFGGFSSLIQDFFEAAEEWNERAPHPPLLIWILRLRSIRNNSEFHRSFHTLASYTTCLTNWYLRLCKTRPEKLDQAQALWTSIIQRCVFAVYGLPDWVKEAEVPDQILSRTDIDQDLVDLDPSFFLPDPLPIAFRQRYADQDYGVSIQLELAAANERTSNQGLRYWLFPASPEENFDTLKNSTGMPLFNVDTSPGEDFDLAFRSIYQAAAHYLDFRDDDVSRRSLDTLTHMEWRFLTIEEFQNALLVSQKLPTRRKR